MNRESTHSQHSTIRRGTIVAFTGSWSSGLAELVILRHDESGQDQIEYILCDNGATARSLAAAFDCVTAGNIVNNNIIHGREIDYAVDNLGLLAAFQPVDREEA